MKPTKRLLVVGVVAAVLLLTCLSPLGWFLFKIDRAVKQSLVAADSGFRKATNSIDPEHLRSWAIETIAKHKPSTNDYFGKGIPNSEIPDYIQKLYPDPPEDATVQLDGNLPCVEIIWGGGMFHWVFYIGYTNDTMPFVSQNTEYPYNFEWKPGIYYTREANWNLQ